MNHSLPIQRATALGGLMVLLTAPAVLADEINIKVNAVTYVPFSSTLTPGTTIYLNADNDPAVAGVFAMQRSLGYREVDYKAIFSTQLAWSPLDPARITTSGGITTYDYSAQAEPHRGP